MKKETLIWPISIVLSSLILGLSLYFVQISKLKIDEKSNEPKIVALQNNDNQKIQDDNFQKKIECEKYKDKINEQINQFNNSQKPYKADNNVPPDPQYPNLRLYISAKELKEVFYSPKVNSCLYLEVSRTYINDNLNAKPSDAGWGTSFEDYYIYDVLSDKQIESISTILRSELMNEYKSVEKLVNDYKK